VTVGTVANLGEPATNTSGSAFEALLSTAPASGGSGAPVSASTLETTLGVAPSTFTTPGFFNGSALTLNFNSAAGNTLSFDYNFLTNETTTSPNQDEAFVYLIGPGSSTPQLLALPTLTPANATTPTNILDNNFTQGMTGYATFSVGALPTNGAYTLEFVVMNQNDSSVSSGLLVDNIILSPNTGPAGGGGGNSVPLPAAGWAGLLGGLLALGFVARMRRQAGAV
jgi:hypothetical protein